MNWITGEEFEAMQDTVNRGEELDVDQCRHLLAEVRRLRRVEEYLLSVRLQVEQVWEAERVAVRERDEAREVANALKERLACYEEKLESETL